MKRIGVCILSILLMLCALPLTVLAEPAVSLKVSSTALSVGDTLTLTVTFSGDSVGAVDASLSYDPGVLEFVAGNDASGGNGVVRIAGYATAEVPSLKYSMTFKAKAAGSSSIRVESSTVYNWKEELTGHPTAGVTVSVKDVTLSQNADLKSLTVSAGQLSPAFSPSVLNYTVTVENSVTSFLISAVPADAGADMRIDGSSRMAVGKNQRTVVVTAPGGATKSYTITITRKEGTSTPTTTAPTTVAPREGVTLTVEGVTYTVGTLRGVELPKGYTAGTCQVGEETVPAALTADGAIRLLWLLPPEGEGGFFYYGADGETVPYRPLNAAEGTFLLLPADGSVALTAVTRKVGEWEHRVWMFPESERAAFCGVRAVAPDGKVGLYCYDTEGNTMQRLVLVVATTTATATVSTETTLLIPTGAAVTTGAPADREGRRWLPWGVSGILALLCVVLFCLTVTYYRRSASGEEPAGEDPLPEETTEETPKKKKHVPRH